MKKNIYLLITALAFSFFAKAQNGVPNGNFENWTSGTYDVPNGYVNSDPETFFRCNTPFNCVKTNDAYHGAFAIQLTTNVGSNDTCFGYALNVTSPNGNNPCQWTGGTPFTQIPTGARGYYKCNVSNPDTAGILFVFKGVGATCSTPYFVRFNGVQNTYTPFSITFNPPIGFTPDTMVFAAVSSNVFGSTGINNGSMLQLDSISLTGIVTQPAAFNGDFENWTSNTLNKPDYWYISGGGGPNSTNGVLRTTDKYAGTYALELQTYLGDRCNGGNNCHPAAQGGQLSTGYYLQNCMGPNCQRGGYPFSKQNDTLCFYYKYAPMANDSADVNVNFKFGGTQVYSTGTRLPSAPSYQYKEIIFNTGTPIDSVIISFQSSLWQDTLLSFIGSDLKVDEVHFHSQPLTTGIKTFDAALGIKIYPNPSNDGNFVVSNVQSYDLVRVYNVYGQEVNVSIKKENDYAKIHIDAPGAYFVTVNARGKITTQKIIVGKD